MHAHTHPDGTVSNAAGVALPVLPSFPRAFRNGRGNGRQYAWRVVAPDGTVWHGRNGGPGLPVRLRPAMPRKRRDGTRYPLRAA